MKRTATIERELRASAERVRGLILDVAGHVEWFDGLDRVEQLADGTWRLGFVYTALLVVARTDAERIVWQVANERRFFEAEWVFEVRAADAGEVCSVRIEERRIVHGWAARVWQRLFLRREHYIRKYLNALERAATAPPYAP